MAVLGNKEQQVLRLRGIEIVSDIYGSRYTFTLRGLFWLLNYLDEARPKKTSFNIALLKALAAPHSPEKWRELRVKAFDLPTYTTSHQQLAIYLNGTPPVRLLNTPATRGIPEAFSLLEVRPFTLSKVAQDTTVEVVVSEAEQGRLSAGECLRFNDQGAAGAS